MANIQKPFNLINFFANSKSSHILRSNTYTAFSIVKAQPTSQKDNGQLKVAKPSKKKGALKKTATVLDWTILPIREFGSLGRNVKLLFLTIRNIFKGTFLIIKMSWRDFQNQSEENRVSKFEFLKSRFRHIYDKPTFFSMLQESDKKQISQLNERFFKRSKFMVLVHLLLLGVGIFFFSLSIGQDAGLFRTGFSFLLILGFGFYTWHKTCLLENLIYAKKRLCDG